MLNNRDCLIYLYEETRISRKKLHQLVGTGHRSYYHAIQSDALDLAHFLSVKHRTLLAGALNNPARIARYTSLKRTYKTWTVLDADYPDVFRTIPDAPIVFYGLGDVDLLKTLKRISIIGSRQPTVNVKQRMSQLLLPLVSDYVIVSGLAKGIDSFAHQLACTNGGRTIGVIASGFNHPYPYETRAQFHDMCRNQLVISEYPIDVKPERYHFPERNRLISALGFATCIIEAKRKSGTMITADQALEQGRIVMAVPGDILNPNTQGCHDLIQQGAKLVQNTQDIEEEWRENKVMWKSINNK